jgi:hypothetical protein
MFTAGPGKAKKVVEEWDVEDEYSYFCPFCSKVTTWNNKPNSCSQCSACKATGSNKKTQCQGCVDVAYVYSSEDKKDEKFCAHCLAGFSLKKMTDIIALPCLFCDDTLQTWYIFAD